MCGIVCATVSMPLNMCDGVYMCVCNHVCVIHADVKVEKPVRAGAIVISGSWDGRACVPYAHLNIYNEHVYFLLSEFFLFDIRHHPAVPFPVLPPVSSLVSAFPASAWQVPWPVSQWEVQLPGLPGLRAGCMAGLLLGWDDADQDPSPYPGWPCSPCPRKSLVGRRAFPGTGLLS